MNLTLSGRINLIDVAKSLNVDSNVVSSLAHEIVKEDSNTKIILGQLIDHSYVIQLAEEIGDRLQQHGLINVTELARNFDLPGEYIHSVNIIFNAECNFYYILHAIN